MNAAAYQSSTFFGYPGLVRFTNTHLPDVDIPAVIEALVHEAIHCVLHVHEECAEPFVPRDAVTRATVVSPWTGATILLPSYIHACAVWYGLYWLWSDARSWDGVPQRRVEEMRHRARVGFERHPASVGLKPFRGLLSASVVGVLEEMEESLHPTS
jgi:hypothetical protein